MEEIADMVGKIKRNAPQTPVLMEGDHQVQYGRVVQMMVALQKAGVNDVGLVTESPAPER